MGLFEKARNITDTELRIVVTEGRDPAESLRRHILSLEESQRQLGSSQGFLARQRQWLDKSAERKLSLAEEWEKRAATAARQDRDDLARHALLRKRELLRSMGEDRRQLDRILPQLEEVDRRLSEVRGKVLKARAVRARLFEDGDVGTIEDDEPGTTDTHASPSADREASGLTDNERQELDEELKDLKQRLKSDE